MLWPEIFFFHIEPLMSAGCLQICFFSLSSYTKLCNYFCEDESYCTQDWSEIEHKVGRWVHFLIRIEKNPLKKKKKKCTESE